MNKLNRKNARSRIFIISCTAIGLMLYAAVRDRLWWSVSNAKVIVDRHATNGRVYRSPSGEYLVDYPLSMGGVNLAFQAQASSDTVCNSTTVRSGQLSNKNLKASDFIELGSIAISKDVPAGCNDEPYVDAQGFDPQVHLSQGHLTFSAFVIDPRPSLYDTVHIDISLPN
jgi:hypothetical protein